MLLLINYYLAFKGKFGFVQGAGYATGTYGSFVRVELTDKTQSNYFYLPTAV